MHTVTLYCSIHRVIFMLLIVALMMDQRAHLNRNLRF